MDQEYIYVMLSRTQSRFAKSIMFVGHQQYSHVAISLDMDFRQVYAFGRLQHNTPLLGRLVQESLERYTLHRNTPVPVMVFQIPVSKEEYKWVKETVKQMMEDPDYIYNLLSVLSYPLFHGFSIPKSFTCVEFVVYILQHMGYMTAKRRCTYKPDDLIVSLQDYLFFKGDIRNCLAPEENTGEYFASFAWSSVIKSAAQLGELARRVWFSGVQVNLSW